MYSGDTMGLIRISPDGKEVLHLYDDKICELTGKHSTLKITRATDVFYDNEIGKWRVEMLVAGYCLPESFTKRSEALAYEKKILEHRLRNGEV
jgi:hypothetical protein